MSEVRATQFNTQDRQLIRQMVDSQWKAAHEARQNASGPAPTITDAELEQLVTRAQLSGLNPLAGHIHATRRDNRMVMVVSIDALRLVANRTECYAPGDDTKWETDPNGKLVSATVYVKKLAGGAWHQYSATAFMDEYAQRYKTNQGYVLSGMWARMPKNQCAKCAEALALRRGFPQELAGLYVEEELQAQEHADAPAYRPENAPQSNVATLAAAHITHGEANRGHGNEGKAAPVQDLNTPQPEAPKASEVVMAEAKAQRDQQVAADRAKWEGIRANSQQISGTITEAAGKTTTGAEKNPFVIFTLETPNGAVKKMTCFDKRFLNLLLNQSKGKMAVVYYKVQKKGNGAEYMNLTDIGEVGGVPYWMGEPQHPDGITDEDIPF